MKMRVSAGVLVAATLLSSCTARHAQEPAKLTVAAAANLTDVMAKLGETFREKSGVEIVFSYGSTSQLAQQIDNGAPFDLFAAADVEHVESLVSSGKLTADSRAVYVRGQLALWIPGGEQSGVRDLKDLAASKVRYVAIAQPELAPYGKAAVEVLNTAGLWAAVKPKLVYANNISLAKQLAATGNAEAAFTAYSLLLHEKGTVLKIDPRLYHPIEQELAIVAASPHIEDAKRFRSFLLGPEGRAILTDGGYLAPLN
jgi:molybdate transport system substrate-binding protein